MKIINFYLGIIIGINILTGCEKKEVPVITTTNVSSITATSAISGGNITDEGSSTVTSRGICWSTGATPTTSDNKTTDGAGAGTFSSQISGLFGGTNYFVRAYASNSSGTGYGMAMSFKTSGEPPSAPIVNIQTATNVQLNGATLNGTVNAKYYSTTVTFEYGTTTGYGNSINAAQSPVTGGTNINVSVSLTNLTVGMTYHYRIKAVNSLGTSYSEDMIFSTLGKVPTVTTLSPTNITTAGAQLNGTVNANYLSTTVTFEYGTTTGYGNSINASQSPITGGTNTNVSASLTNLPAGTTFHYRVKAVNSLGTTYGNDMTIITLGNVPTITPLPATNPTIVTLQLNCTVNANYFSTEVTFEYGTTTSYGSTVTATQSPITGSTNKNVSVTITGLTAETTYHYRIKATNSLGTSYSEDKIFIHLYYGLSYQGGLVFYLDGTGQHGLVCAPNDQGAAPWGCEGMGIIQGTAVGTGNQNTIAIVNKCSTVGIAARICYDLDLNGYNDWFLPSKDELSYIYTNLKSNGLGGFVNDNYWSSSSWDGNNSWHQYFYNGNQYASVLYASYNVRAVRAF